MASATELLAGTWGKLLTHLGTEGFWIDGGMRAQDHTPQDELTGMI